MRAAVKSLAFVLDLMSFFTLMFDLELPL